MKSDKAKTIFIIMLSVLLAMSIFTQILFCSLLGIKNVDSLKRVMLANDRLNSMSTPELENSVEEPAEVVQIPESTPMPTEPMAPSAESTEANKSTIVLDSAGVKITYLGADYDTFWDGYKLKFAIENNSDTNLLITSKDETVNGFMADTSIGLYCEVLSGKKAVDEMTLYAFELESLGITDPKTVEFKLSVTNSEDIFTDIAKTDTITIDLK